jgi:hypothetical protein
MRGISSLGEELLTSYGLCSMKLTITITIIIIIIIIIIRLTTATAKFFVASPEKSPPKFLLSSTCCSREYTEATVPVIATVFYSPAETNFVKKH